MTIGRNTGEGVFLQNPQTATASGVIVAGNTLAACAGGAGFTSATGSITDGTTCGFPLQALDPQLSADLVPFPTGTLPTSVLTIPASSPAVDIVNPCQYPIDQRFEPRYSAALAPCDAGAYEQSASGTGGQVRLRLRRSTPRRTRPDADAATDIHAGSRVPRSVVVEPVRGTVRVCPRRPTQCRRCALARRSRWVDGRHAQGRVELTSLSSAGGRRRRPTSTTGSSA